MIAKLVVTDNFGLSRTFKGSHDDLEWLYHCFLKDANKYAAIDIYDKDGNRLYEKLLISHVYTQVQGETVSMASNAKNLHDRLFLAR